MCDLLTELDDPSTKASYRWIGPGGLFDRARKEIERLRTKVAQVELGLRAADRLRGEAVEEVEGLRLNLIGTHKCIASVQKELSAAKTKNQSQSGVIAGLQRVIDDLKVDPLPPVANELVVACTECPHFRADYKSGEGPCQYQSECPTVADAEATARETDGEHWARLCRQCWHSSACGKSRTCPGFRRADDPPDGDAPHETDGITLSAHGKPMDELSTALHKFAECIPVFEHDADISRDLIASRLREVLRVAKGEPTDDE